MSAQTRRFGLAVLNADTDTIARDGYQFGVRDRRFIDQALAYVIEAHVHGGAPPPAAAALPAPRVTPRAVDGRSVAGSTVYYRFSLVDERGQEGSASSVAATPVPVPIPPPRTLALTPNATAGALAPGLYAYAISACTGRADAETLSGPTQTVTLPAGGQIIVHLPSTPESGEDGYNIYRRGPGDEDYGRVAAMVTTDWPDNGIAPDPNVRRPTANTTHTHDGNQIDLPVPLPLGYTWRLYRTYDRNHWDNSLLYWGGDTTVLDLGQTTRFGTPLALAAATGSPPVTDLARHTTGTLPPGVNVFGTEVVVHKTGPLAVGPGEHWWFNPYRRADIVSLRAWLDRDAVSDTDVTVLLVSTSALSSSSTETTATDTFTFTGAVQDWTVPAGVTAITVDALGAAGGDEYAVVGTLAGGGRVQCDLAVTPGETLRIVVGGAGSSGVNPNAGPVPGGFNGGGAADGGGGGGGGATDIRRTPYGLADRVIVAGGGGGRGGNNGEVGFSGGGGGQTPTGESGQAGVSTGGGGGGTASAGGSGGTGLTAGSAGTLGTGGAGGVDHGIRGGGGGGGGLYGGGGGGTAGTGSRGGGGGGGSGLSTGVAETLTANTNFGDGQAVFTYTTATAFDLDSLATVTIPAGHSWSERLMFGPVHPVIGADEGILVGLNADPGTLTPADASLHVAATFLVAGAVEGDDTTSHTWES